MTSDGDEIGIGFYTASGETVCVEISVIDALNIGQLARSHSLGSSGIPSIDVSSISKVRS